MFEFYQIPTKYVCPLIMSLLFILHVGIIRRCNITYWASHVMLAQSHLSAVYPRQVFSHYSGNRYKDPLYLWLWIRGVYWYYNVLRKCVTLLRLRKTCEIIIFCHSNIYENASLLNYAKIRVWPIRAGTCDSILTVALCPQFHYQC